MLSASRNDGRGSCASAGRFMRWRWCCCSAARRVAGRRRRSPAAASTPLTIDEDAAACLALLDLPNLTITMAKVVVPQGDTPRYCYVRGAIPPGIAYHVQLPLPANWNGRFLLWGDGTKDGRSRFRRQASRARVRGGEHEHGARRGRRARRVVRVRQSPGPRSTSVIAPCTRRRPRRRSSSRRTTRSRPRTRTSRVARRVAAKGSWRRSAFRTISTASAPALPSCTTRR